LLSQALGSLWLRFELPSGTFVTPQSVFPDDSGVQFRLRSLAAPESTAVVHTVAVTPSCELAPVPVLQAAQLNDSLDAVLLILDRDVRLAGGPVFPCASLLDAESLA
jgi:hypothetical protein